MNKNSIPLYTLTSNDWSNIDQVPSYAVNLDVGVNEYLFSRPTPTNDFITSTGLVNDSYGIKMVGGKAVLKKKRVKKDSKDSKDLKDLKDSKKKVTKKKSKEGKDLKDPTYPKKPIGPKDPKDKKEKIPPKNEIKNKKNENESQEKSVSNRIKNVAVKSKKVLNKFVEKIVKYI
jgi:hypothetical protein